MTILLVWIGLQLVIIGTENQRSSETRIKRNLRNLGRFQWYYFFSCESEFSQWRELWHTEYPVPAVLFIADVNASFS